MGAKAVSYGEPMTTTIFPPPVLTCDEQHRYWLGERELPGTTRIINAVIPRQFNPGNWYMDRGSSIHKSIQLAIAGKLNFNQYKADLWTALGCDEAQVILNKIAAAQKFINESGFTVAVNGLKLHSTSLWFAGELDVLLKDPKEKYPVLVDFKSSISPTAHVYMADQPV